MPSSAGTQTNPGVGAVPGVSYLAANFVFDYAVLWATGRLQGMPAAPLRLALGAWLGAAFFGVLPPMPSPGLTAAACVGLSWLMVRAAFPARSPRASGALLATMWAAGCVAAGAGLAAQSLLGRGPSEAAGPAVSLAVLAVVAVTARRGPAAWDRAWRVGLQLGFGGRTLWLQGLVDTGNRLLEPVESLPVILVEPRALAPLFHPALVELVQELARDPLGAAGRLPGMAPEWARRFRLVPFRSVGTERGVMAGFRADRVVVERGPTRDAAVGPAVVALSPTPLGCDPARALVPAECVVAAGRARPAGAPARRGRREEGGISGAGVA